MKTAEETLKKFMVERGKMTEEEWIELFKREDSKAFLEAITDAFKAYAEQAIDRCAEEAQIKYFPDCIDNNARVDKDSILKLKSELK